MIKKSAVQKDVEVEIKIPVTKSLFESVRSYLQKHAKFISQSQEVDKYYSSPGRNFMAVERPVEYLRIRFNDRGGSIAYKKVHLDAKGRRTHSDEFESPIGNIQQLEKIFAVLNFDNILTVDKMREKFKVANKFEIALDFVKGLGYFVEIEALKDFGGKENAYKQVASFAIKLGLDPEKVDLNGYVLGLMQKKGLVKQKH